MARSFSTLLLAGVILCSIGAGASAQEAAPSSPPPTASRQHGASHAGGAFGFGGIAYLSGPAGLSLAYDAGIFHIDTLIGLSGGVTGVDSFLQLGGRFWYHVSSTGPADLSIGGGFLYERIDTAGPADAINNLFIEVGGLIRVFLAPNVALGIGTGLVLGTADADGYSVGNTTLVANAGVHYFF